MQQKGVKSMRKTVRFFAVCGAVCALGIILTVAGFAMGGASDMEKIEGNHTWFNVGPMHKETDEIELGEFDSIKADGNMDIAVIGSGFAGEIDSALGEDTLGEEWIEKAYNEDFAGKVMIRWKDGEERPEVSVEEGVLVIHSNSAGPEMEVNLSTEDSMADVVVFCGEAKLKNVDISTDCGDIAVGGIECENLNISNGAGDIEVSSVTGGKMMFKVDAGDISMENCKGDITAEVHTGDIEFDAAVDMSQFQVSLQAGAGDVQVNDSTEEVSEFSHEGGPNKLTCRTDTGDIEVDFFNTGEAQEL